MTIKITISYATRSLIQSQTLTGYAFGGSATRRADGRWDVEVDAEVYEHLRAHRLEGETDDDTLGRLLRAALGSQPN